MGDSDILQMFQELREPGKDWPGGRPPVNRTPDDAPRRPAEEGVDEWRNLAQALVYRGRTRAFYTIGALSKALGRSEVTIRSWEAKGLMPKTPYRTPAPSNPLPGTKPAGRRLWTVQQIEGILRICVEEGVILDGKTPPTREWGLKVAQLYRDLFAADHSDER